MAAATVTYSTPIRSSVSTSLIAYDAEATLNLQGFTFTEGTTYYAVLTKSSGQGALADRATVDTEENTVLFDLENVVIDAEFRLAGRTSAMAARVTVFAADGERLATFTLNISPGSPNTTGILAPVGAVAITAADLAIALAALTPEDIGASTLETPVVVDDISGAVTFDFSAGNSLVAAMVQNVTSLAASNLPAQTCAVLIAMSGNSLPASAPAGAISENWDVSGTYTRIVIFDWGWAEQWDAYPVEVAT